MIQNYQTARAYLGSKADRPLPGHARSVDIEVNAATPEGEDRDVATPDGEALREALRDLMIWFYRALEKDFEWSQSDETVAENIQANAYEFWADGRRSCV